MSFLNPILLGVGLACVAIPIAIHLLMRRRRKPVRWAAMRFLLEAYRKRRQRLRLEQILLLAARCLLVALIAFAVGRPLVSRAGALGGGARDVYILLDNSLASALAPGEQGDALGRSIDEAARLLEGLDGARGDRAALVLLGGEPQPLVFPPTSDLAQVERRLREVRATDAPMELAGALSLVAALEDADEPRAAASVVILSEFREGSVGGAPVLPGLGERLVLATPPADGPAANTGIVGAELLRPVLLTGGAEGGAAGASGQVRVRLMRTGEGVDDAAVTRVQLVVLGERAPTEAGSSFVEWTPGQSEAQATVDVRIEDDAARGRAILRVQIDRDANERDNTAWAVLQVRERLRVALIGTRRFGERRPVNEFGPTDWLSLALRPTAGPDSEIDVDILDAARLDAGQLAGFDAAVVAEPERLHAPGWDALGDFASRGGAVMLCASREAGAQLWVEPAAGALSLLWDIEREPTPLESARLQPAPPGPADLLWYLRGELPELAETVTLQRILGVRTDDAGDVLLQTEDGRPVLLALTPGEGGRAPASGAVALLATAIDMDWTDLPARPLMVPLVQEMVRSGVGSGGALRFALAGGRLQAPGGAVEVREVAPSTDSGQLVGVDPSTGLTREAVRRAGVYEARDASGRESGFLCVQPSAPAGRARIVDAQRVQAWLATSAGSPDRFAWLSDGAPQAGVAQGEPARTADAGPGLALLAGALLLACAELCLARIVSHAARPAPAGPEAAA